MHKVWRRLLGLCTKTVLEEIEYDEDDDVVVAHVRPKSRFRRRCGICGRRSPGLSCSIRRTGTAPTPSAAMLRSHDGERWAPAAGSSSPVECRWRTRCRSSNHEARSRLR